MIHAIALDLEGTIINIENIHHQAHILAAKDAGLTLTLLQCFEKIPHFIGGPNEKIVEEIARLSGRNEKFISDCGCQHFDRLFKDATIELRPGFPEVLAWFQTNKLKITIGSLTRKERALILLEKSGLTDLISMENIVLRENVNGVKPSPEVWFKTAERANVDPRDQLIFDDSHNGIMAAVRAGSLAIGMPVYNEPFVVSRLLEAGAIRVFIDWREINISSLIENLNNPVV